MSEADDARYMRMALDLAETALGKAQSPFGAVVVSPDGTVVGSGHNQVRADRDPSAHGEMTAIRDAWRRLGSATPLATCTLYTSCEPCLLCSYAITQLRIRRVVFAARWSDVPTSHALLNTAMSGAAEWVNRQADWAPIEVRADFMREDAKRTLARFPWDEEPTFAERGGDGDEMTAPAEAAEDRRDMG